MQSPDGSRIKKSIAKNETFKRQYNLIRYTTIQSVLVCILIIFLYSITGLWHLAALITLTTVAVLVNLWLLKRTENINLCGHIITWIILITIVAANYLVRGLNASYSLWFYLLPLLAASLVGWKGFLIYSTGSLFLIVGFSFLSIPPFYNLTPQQLHFIDLINRIFAYIVIVSTLINLLRENRQYEQALRKKNYLLRIEKRKYRYLARFDSLTNLPNRQYFKYFLQKAINTLAPNEHLTVFFMDLDNFKYVNDHFGHKMGDYLLLQTAKRLQTCFRETDFIARLGGDEFTAVVLCAPNEDIVDTICERITQEFRKPFTLGNTEYLNTISLGLSIYPQDADTVSDLMAKADMSMYESKVRDEETLRHDSRKDD